MDYCCSLSINLVHEFCEVVTVLNVGMSVAYFLNFHRCNYKSVVNCNYKDVCICN